jgi:FKBP-type peptidyl-prolyl cis-trans isomerase
MLDCDRKRLALRLDIKAGLIMGLVCSLAACAGHGNGARSVALADALIAAPSVGVVSLPGLQYEVLHSGPAGPRPGRSDNVTIKYVGRLADGSIFSTSAKDGAQPSDFAVRTVIPGFSALVQLMRPGDFWRITIPSHLAYGYRGRPYVPPETTLRRDVPPDSTLIFDVELISIRPGIRRLD